MNFECRKIEQSDYDNTLKGWWTDWGFEPPPYDFLSDYGLIIYDKDGKNAQGFCM